MIRQGDFVIVDFSPVKGREQGGARPAFVLSTATFHSVSELATVCPVTSNTGAWPYKVEIGPDEPVSGFVMVDQIRSVHRASRGFRKLGEGSPQLLHRVKALLADFLLIPFQYINETGQET